MHSRYAVLLLSLACSTPGPVYERGTFTPPPPAPTRPGIGLPQPHMPGQHVRPKVEPNPRPKRHLPPTPGGGPGIWAMDDDVPEVDPKEFTILGVVLPLPPEAYEGKPADIQPAMECAKHWNKVLGTAAAKWVHDLKDDAVRRCLVAFMNGVCATLPDALQEHIMKPAGVVSLDVRKYTPEMTRRADAFIDLMCRDARTIGFYIDRFKKLAPDYYEVAFRDALGRVK